ncbi:hypothetical protein ACQUEF_03605 [Vagococcus fluvialis]|uniref:hypothetical protein n=1 Tax=Vagococcus fluvialis TaxID=2738 RepID=UPI003D0A2B43
MKFKFEVLKTGANVLNNFTKKQPVVTGNIVVDNDYWLDKTFNKPRKYDNLYNFAQNKTTIMNNSEKEIIVNEVRCKIDSVKKYEYEDLKIIYGINEQNLFVYLCNNGNIKSSISFLEVETYAYLDGGETTLLHKYQKDMEIEGEEILLLMDDNLKENTEELFLKNNNYIGLMFKIIDSNSEEYDLALIYYNRETGEFNFGGLGGGAFKERINLIELDVDNYKKEYIFNNLQLSINSLSSEQIDMYIMPTESCQIDYNLTFMYNDKPLKNTEICEESVIIKVPAFRVAVNQKLQLIGPVSDFLVRDKIKKYKKGTNEHIDNLIGSNLDYVKTAFSETILADNAPS